MSGNDLSIKLTIAGRVYPLTIRRSEEELMRKAARQINERIREYEEQYAVKDRQDLLAMCALEYANQALARDGDYEEERKDVHAAIGKMDKVVADYLETV